MGKKQTAFITDLKKQFEDCERCVGEMKKTSIKVVVLNGRINDSHDAAAIAQFKADKIPLITAMIKSRSELRRLVNAFASGITTFEAFVNKKSDRWAFKSTLTEAKDFLVKVKAAKKKLDEVLEKSEMNVL